MRNDNGIEDIYIGGEYSKKNKNNKFIIFVIICSIVLIAIVGTYLFMRRSSKNVSKEAFDKAFSSNNIVKLSDVSFYKDVYEKIMNQNSGIDTMVNFQMGASNQDSNKIDLTKVSFNFSTKSQVSDNKTSTDVTVNYSNNEFFKFNVLTSKRSFGIAQDEIVNRYIASDYNTARATMGVNISQKKVDKWTSLETFDLSEKEREEYIRNLYKKLIDNISEDKFTTSNNIVLNTDSGSSVPVTAYTLSLSQDEFKDYLISLLTIVRNDEELLNKIVTNTSSEIISVSSEDPNNMFSGVSNIESLIASEEDDTNINVVINRVQSERTDDDVDRSTSSRSTENMFNVDGDDENNRDENSSNRNDNNNANNENNGNSGSNNNQVNNGENSSANNNSNTTNNGANDNPNSNNMNNGNSNNRDSNTQSQQNDSDSNRTNTTNTTNTTNSTGGFQVVRENGFFDLSASKKNFETSLSVDSIRVDDVESIERENQELEVSRNVDTTKQTIITSLVDDLGLDDLQITEIKKSEIFKNQKFENMVRLMLGIKLDMTKDDLQKKIDEYINEVKQYKGNGITIIVYVSEEKTEKISFEMPNSNKLDIEILKSSDEENSMKFTYLYKGTNSQLFDIQEKVTYSADEDLNVNSEESDKLNGFSIQMDKFSKDSNNNLKLSYQKIDQEEVQKKIMFNLRTIGDVNSNEIKNSINISISAKDKPEEQYSISNLITFSIVPNIEGLTDDNCVRLDELTSEDYDKLMLILQDKVNQVRRNKERNLNLIVSNTSNESFNRNDFITNSISRDEARELIIKSVRELMEKAEEEEREFSLEDLNELNIDGYSISKNISEEKAIIVIDVYTFEIDKDLQLSDG